MKHSIRDKNVKGEQLAWKAACPTKRKRQGV